MLELQKEIQQVHSKIQQLIEDKADKDTIEKLKDDLKKLQKEKAINKVKREVGRLNKLNKEDYDKKEELNKIYQKIYELHLKNDDVELPSKLFFHYSIVNAYGEFIELYDKEVLKGESSKKFLLLKKQWLESKVDKGEKYFILYDKLYSKLDKEKYITIEKKIEKMLKENILKENCDWDDLNNKIQQYTISKIKSKKIKEIYKEILKTVSDINNTIVKKFLEYKYNIQIPILIDEKTKENIFNIQLLIELEELLLLYEKEKKNYHDTLQFREKTLKHLDTDYYDFLVRQYSLNLSKQDGKYSGKEWNELSEQEKNERIISFCDFNKKSIKFKEFLQKEILKIKFKWDSVNGYIKGANLSNYNIDYDSDIYEKKLKKKWVSNKSILNKNTELIINEEILKNILLHKKEEEIIECVKTKLRIIKISKNDKEKIKEVYKKMLNIVKDELVEI